MPLPPLPIDAVLPALVAALREHPAAVLRAPTGSGKTTRVPGALLDAGLLDGQVVMLEPRRVAARAAARRIAFERQTNLGDEVGYQVRFDQRVSARTRIRIVTDGILLRMLQDDPFLETVSVVVFDEFHERGLNADLALAMVRRIQATVRPDLKIVAMSATLDLRGRDADTETPTLATFLGNCPVISAEGRLHPVDIRHRPVGRQPLPELAAEGIKDILPETAGDVLAFLPGVGEIRRTQDLLAGLARDNDLLVMPLYGDLPPEQQDAVLQPQAKRKVVLATNVAETSLTIEGVTAVVDTGYARMLQFDAALGLDHLVLQRISKSSADQRAGRAGRTSPGLCLRLWSERDHLALPEFTEPEVRRVDLCGPALQLHCWGEDPSAFPWFERPPPLALEQAEAVLSRLGALVADAARVHEGTQREHTREPRVPRGATDTGKAMVRLPVHPRIARLILEGQRLSIAPRACLAAALLSERDPFTREPGRRRSAVHVSQSDVVDRVTALEDFERRGTLDSESGRLHPGGARSVLKVRDQLSQLLARGSEAHAATGPEVRLRSESDRLRFSLFAAYADRLARRREKGSRRGLMVGGRGVRLDDASTLAEAELFVCIDVDAGGNESLVRQASAVEREWLPEQDLTTVEQFGFDDSLEKVTAVRQSLWFDLPVFEASMPLLDDGRAARALAEAAARDLSRAMPKADDDVLQFLARVRCLREWCPELDLPPFDDQHIRTQLPALCEGRRSLAELRRAPWLAFLKGLLTWPQLQTVDREAPERLSVPSGKRIALRYEEGSPPVLACRIQDLFGLAETPKIARSRVSVLLHLLAPNMRTQQVTTDLKSFWTNTYPQVRKDLRRRYPKHAWPEDPWEFCDGE